MQPRLKCSQPLTGKRPITERMQRQERHRLLWCPGPDISIFPFPSDFQHDFPAGTSLTTVNLIRGPLIPHSAI